MYYTENSHHSLDLLFSLILKPKLDPVIIIFFSCQDDFASLRADILPVNSKEIRLRNDNLEYDVSPFSESLFLAEN